MIKTNLAYKRHGKYKLQIRKESVGASELYKII